MTAAAEAAAPEEAVVALAREIRAALLRDVAAQVDAAREWADWEVAGGKPPKWVIRELDLRLAAIAAAARGQAATR